MLRGRGKKGGRQGGEPGGGTVHPTLGVKGKVSKAGHKACESAWHMCCLLHQLALLAGSCALQCINTALLQVTKNRRTHASDFCTLPSAAEPLFGSWKKVHSFRASVLSSTMAHSTALSAKLCMCAYASMWWWAERWESLGKTPSMEEHGCNLKTKQAASAGAR